MVQKKYIALSNASVTMNDGVPQYDSGTTTYSCGMMECVAGDIFTVSGTGGNSTRQWGFIDSSGNILRVAGANITTNEIILVAPDNAAWIIVHTNNDKKSYKGYITKKDIQNLKNNLSQRLDDMKGDLKDISSLSYIHYHIPWDHGRIDNETGETIYDESTTRSMDISYHKASDFYSVVNNSTVVLWIIFYTKNNSTYTFSSASSLTPTQHEYLFNSAPADAYFRLDLRGNLTEAESVELLYSTELRDTVDRFISKEYLLEEIPERENLFNVDNVIEGKYINNTNGKESSKDNYYATEFIPVRAGTTYYTGGIYATYTALYDENKIFIAGNVVTATNNLGTFTPSVDGFFRGSVTSASYLEKAYISPYHAYYSDYTDIDFSLASKILKDQAAIYAIGEDTPNKFDGVCFYGNINGNTGVESFSTGKIITSFIPINGIMHYKLFGGKTGDISVVYEYDSTKSFISYSSL